MPRLLVLLLTMTAVLSVSAEDPQTAVSVENRGARSSAVGSDKVATPEFDDSKTVLELSLRDAVRTALRNNVNVKIEELNRQISRRDLIIQKAVFDPYFNVGFSQSKNRDPTVSPFVLGSGVFLGVAVNPFEATTGNAGFRGNTVLGSTYSLSLVEDRFDNPEASFFSLNPQYRTRVQVNLTQPLLKNAWYDYNSANIRVAKNNRLLSEEQLNAVASDTIYNVILAFWELVFAHENFRAKINALGVAEEQLRIDRRRVEIGQMAEIDLTTPESQVARRKTELDDAQSALETARDDLLYRMNFSGARSLRRLWSDGRTESPFQSIQVVPVTPPNMEPVAAERTASLELAFSRRPECARLEIDIRNQRIQVGQARNQLLPNLDVTASWAQAGLDNETGSSFGALEEGRFYSWTVGLQFEVQLPFRGRVNTYHNSRDSLRQLEFQKQDLENTIVIEVDQSIRDLEFAYRAVQNLGAEVRVQESLLGAERSKLRVGTSDAYTVSQIENDLIDVRARELRAQTDFENTKAAYEKAVGGLLETWGGVGIP